MTLWEIVKKKFVKWFECCSPIEKKSPDFDEDVWNSNVLQPIKGYYETSENGEYMSFVHTNQNYDGWVFLVGNSGKV